MVVVQSPECPRCGAPLPKGIGASVVCKYCNVTVSVEQRGVPRTSPRSQTGLPEWAQAFVKPELLFGLVVGVGMLAWQVYRFAGPSTIPHNDFPDIPSTGPVNSRDLPPEQPPSVDSRLVRALGKLIITSDKSSQPLLLTVASFADKANEQWLAAIRPDRGQVAWRWPLPNGVKEAHVERAVIEDAVVVRTAEQVTRLDVATGDVVWQAGAPAPQGRLCATQAYVAVKGDKPPMRALDWTTGQPFDVKPGACELPYSSADAASNFQYLELAALQKLPKGKNALRPVRGLLPKQGNARVILGTVARGSEPTPVVSVVANGRWVWQTDVSAYTFAALPEPALAAVRRESVVVPYWDTQNGHLRLSAFNLESGSRLWDAAVSDPTTVQKNVDIDVAVTLEGMVLVRLFDGRLQAYALATGELAWSMGG